MSLDRALLSARDMALYSKLDASYNDIGTARACAAFIKKKEWHTYAYLRRGSVPLQQTAFTTTMIVAYARPFSPGRGNISFPHRLLEYRPEEQALHERLMMLRNQDYAHTDAANHDVIPLKGNFITQIQTIKATRFAPSEIAIFLTMTGGLLGRIKARMETLRLREDNP